ncbi:hypothetical protein OROMI_026366 [Orobanche minor]
MANKHLFFLIAIVYWETVSLHVWAVTDELEVSSSSRAVQVLKQPITAGILEIRGCGPLSRNMDRSSVLWIIHNQPVKLHGLGLTGNLGVELSNLKSLKHMDLSANNIEGSFPYILPPNLTNLNLAANKLSQSITYSFEKMKHLWHLNLGHNFLTGPLDDVLNGLENLKLIDLSFNSFTGELPTSFGSLINLTGLFNYIIRGCRACGLGCNFQFQRLMESMIFIGDEICYRAKYYLTIDKLFAARADLYRTVYTHAKVKCVFYNEFYVLMDILEIFRNITDQDIIYSQKNGGVSLIEEDMVFNNVRPDLTCGRHSLLGSPFRLMAEEGKSECSRASNL